MVMSGNWLTWKKQQLNSTTLAPTTEATLFEIDIDAALAETDVDAEIAAAA